MCLRRVLPLLLLPMLFACSDQRAAFEIKGAAHSLNLIRVISWPWQKNAKFSIVASRMPDCMRRHAMSEAPPTARVEVYAPGNDAWILKQDDRMFVTETRTCEGFAKLDAVPEGGLGPLMGAFEIRGDALTFVAASKPVEPAPAPAAEAGAVPLVPAAPSAPVAPAS